MAWESNTEAAYLCENNLNDDTGNGYTGNVYGSLFSTSQAYEGSYSIYCNNNGGIYGLLPQSLTDKLKTLSAWTIEVYVYIPSGLTVGENVVMAHQASGNIFNFSLFPIDGGHPYRPNYLYGFSGGYNFAGITSGHYSNWVRHNLEWTGSRFNEYINGSLAGFINSSNNPFNTSSNRIYIGRYNTGGASKIYIDRIIISSTLRGGNETQKLPDTLFMASTSNGLDFNPTNIGGNGL